jgi:hypothetical protein
MADSTYHVSEKLFETTCRAKELCVGIQDTLDSWIELGGCFDKLACEFIQAEGGKVNQPRKTLRKRDKSARGPQGLRKKAIAHLETLVQSTGFDGKQINTALQYYALESNAAWVSQLKSERKAKEIKALARWHWEGCRLTSQGKQSLEVIHKAIADVGFESVTVKEVRAIVRGILGKTRRPRILDARPPRRSLRQSKAPIPRNRPIGMK